MRQQINIETYKPEFEAWYEIYPRKVARGDAERAYAQQRRKGYTADEVKGPLETYAARVRIEQKEKEFLPYPATWLRSQRYLDSDLQPFRLTQQKAAESIVNNSWNGTMQKVVREIGEGYFKAYFADGEFKADPIPTIIASTQTKADYIRNKFRFPLTRLWPEWQVVAR